MLVFTLSEAHNLQRQKGRLMNSQSERNGLKFEPVTSQVGNVQYDALNQLCH